MRMSRCGIGSIMMLASVVVVTYAATGIDVEDREESLAKQLLEIRAANRTASIDPNVLEMRCLELIEDHNTPAERGMIYASATFVQCERGFGRASERALRVAKTIQYAQKALEYPLDTLTSCRIYGYYCDALSTASLATPEKERGQGRRQAAIACLEGLKIALDNDAPGEMPTAPLPVVYNAFGFNGEMSEEVTRMAETQKVERDEYKRLRELFLQRRALIDRCVTLYAREPHEIEGLRSVVLDILSEHGEVATEIIHRVETQTRSETPVPRD